MVVRVILLAMFGAYVLVAAGCSSSPSPELPANGKILFLRQHDYVAQIYSMNPDGSGQTRLTNDGYNYSSVSWSSDGRRILFRRFEDRGYVERFRPADYTPGPYDQEGEGTFVMNADGTGLRRIVESRKGSGFVWSPDAKAIAYSGGGQITVMNVDGTGGRELTTQGSFSGKLAWSPDGSRIAFVKEHDFVQDVFAVNLDGTGVEQLTQAPRDYFEIHPVRPSLDWSPDGSRIVFLAGDGFDVDLYAAAADGGIQQRLTHEPSWRSSPSWSPDGSHLAYAKKEGLMLMRSDGSSEVNLTEEVGQPTSYLWAPDGSSIIFKHRNMLYSVDTDGNAPPQPLPYVRGDERIQDWQPLP